MRKFLLRRLLHVPTLSHNLISVNRLINDNSCSVIFYSNGFTIKDSRTNWTLLQGPSHRGLYPIKSSSSLQSSVSSTDQALHTTTVNATQWHQRLGHPAISTQRLLSTVLPTSTLSNTSFHCSACVRAKSHRLSFILSSPKTTKCLQLIHSDIWGPSPVVSLNGYKYYLLFVDDYTRFSWVYPLRTKSEKFKIFVKFKSMAENQFQSSIKCLRTDGGGEYINHSFKKFLTHYGIVHQVTCPYTPQQNGVAERKHRHLLDTLRALLFQSSLPHVFWPEALLTAAHTINRLPSPNTKHKSPYELLHLQKPDYTHFRVFGCLCYPWIPPSLHHKFMPHAAPCIFLGYAEPTKGYKCFNLTTGRIHLSRHVKFFEFVFPYQKSATPINSETPSINLPPSLLIPTQLTSPLTKINTAPINIQPAPSSLPVPSPAQSSASTSIPLQSPQLPSPQPVQTKHSMVTRFQTGHLHPKKIFDLHTAIIPTQPTSYSQAVKYEPWRWAMSSEFDALQTQGTWTLVPPSPEYNVLDCKWLYRTKFNPYGSVARYKARLVAQGFNQEFGLYYFDTFSPVAKFPTIRILFDIAVNNSWPILQLDVSNAFLNGILQETVYMKQPQGFIDAQLPTYVCCLKKALYGLKQAPRKWFDTFTKFLSEFGFKKSLADPSLFIYTKDTSRLYLLIYVDDILLTGNDSSITSILVHHMQRKFKLSNLAPVSNFLGIQVQKHLSGLHLSQTAYAMSLLERSGMQNCKPVQSLLPTKLPSVTATSPLYSNPEQYRRLVGALQYLTITRPDISFAVNLLCQQMHQPYDIHFQLLKRVLRYIRGTLSLGLPITSSSLKLHAYSDSDWATDPATRRSISGHCAFLGSTLISWCVKKQTTVARSSTEAEYRSLALATAEVLWLRQLLRDFSITTTQPTELYCDNSSALALAQNPVFHSRTKHIDIDFHFIRDCIAQGKLTVHHLASEDKPVDLFTKALSIGRFQALRSKLTLCEQSLTLRGGC
ncbi:Retrovirus-related Pol polyprotein from transposon TNT 1-94 [Dendrobium catenatum]|uniref:Retrovirus-related Pol polyprotein from transposon TNT 1-94 n=1 Tax=Dendrobium catenatum TaxID=906689 RepID=A0A2I0VWW1_9ASPA|nr:Retrovirus-related Pol polyprotein from transposon TNT 1-94 [Dendrobium catenatum]